ncbi:adenylate/guanylate cyclase domain-containing protein [Nitrosomonas communis]|uniref:adenylate/guanylate cyclase domain-containing protein n=1 Tax=Nitrosomonas communis TaxID=44574 RepID=UPI003D2A0193
MERVQKGSIWLIADGVGPEERGLQASRLAATSIVDAYWHSAIPNVGDRLRAAFERTNALLFAQSRPELGPRGLFGATAIAGVIIENLLYIAHAGRSRAYLLRGESFRQLTNDHSWVAEQVRAGNLSPAEAATHPRRNVITRCLGFKDSIEVDIIQETLKRGDLVLLCSDGLYRQVEDSRIATILHQHGSNGASMLVDEAKRLGGQDNITAVTIAVSPPADEELSAFDRIALLNRLSRELTMSLDLDATLRSVMHHLLALTGGEHGAILLTDDDGRLSPMVVREIADAGQPGGLSETVAYQALRERKPILIENALDDPRFSTAESIIYRALRSIACVPMIIHEDAIGVLYVDSSAESGVFDQTDLDLLVSFAGQAAAAIQNARLHQTVLARTRELEVARTRQDSIFRSLSSALIAVDNHSTITHWNQAAEQLFGIPATAAVGATLGKVLPSPVAAWLSNLVVQAEMDAYTLLTGLDWEGKAGGRDRVILSGRVTRIRNPDDEMDGFVFILDDRTEIVLIDEARRAERADRSRLRDLFSHYVAPAVVDQLLNAPDAVQLGGARRDITILFADVRGFTGFSEKHRPEEVVALLNSYLALATSEILNQLGTIDKFLGDGVMAIFGAPLPLECHELAAVRAALAMRSRLDQLRRETGVRVGFGIGLNSGTAIVGNIGTPELLNYTAIGDVVNVAARLQAEARSGEILISEATLMRVANRVEGEELGPLYVKGRADPVSTYKVTRIREEPA